MSPRAPWTRAFRPFRQPVVGFGLAIVSFVWIDTATLIFHEASALRNQGASDAEKLSLIIGQNVSETVNAIDRTLKFLRWVEKHDDYKPDWSAILSEDRDVDDEAVQTSVIDKNGVMVSSSVMLHPDKPVDLSDRLHFQSQARSSADELFIGPVVVGRVSGVATVQFSRKRVDDEGRFLGVVVLSLPADHFDRHFAKLDFGPGDGLALVGDDDLVRAGNGIFRALVGERLDANRTVAADGFEFGAQGRRLSAARDRALAGHRSQCALAQSARDLCDRRDAGFDHRLGDDDRGCAATPSL